MDFEKLLDTIRTEVMKRGGTHADMAQQAHDEIKRANKINEFFAEYGTEALTAIFRHAESRHRNGYKFEPPGKPKVDVKSVNKQAAILEIPFTPNRIVKRLGDLTVEDCKWLKENHTSLSETNLRRAGFFGTVGTKMIRTKMRTVSDAYRDNLASLIKLYRKGFEDE